MSRKPQQPDQAPLVPEKIHKILATAGIGSRRQIEGWIEAGRVSVNDEIAHVGQRVTTADRIMLDGALVSLNAQTNPEVIIMNKASGVVCSRRDEEGRPTVFDSLPNLRGSRWISIGRLDMQTTGLLLLTNDGSLAHKLMHPSTGLDREYAVRINAELEDDVLARLRAGVEVDGELMRFSDIRYFNGGNRNHWYHVVLMEGKNREVRRLFESVGCVVSRLKRVRYGPVVLPSWLRNRQWALLQQEDLRTLYKMLGLNYRGPQKGQTQTRRARVAKTTCLLPYPDLKG